MLPDNIQAVSAFLPNTPLLKLDDPWLKKFDINLYIKRDDLIDQRVSGNKFRKLKYALSHYTESNYKGIVSFGGPWSNHLHALSLLTNLYKIPFVVIIRGEKPANLSATLKDIIQSGADVHYVSRSNYREFRDLSAQGVLHLHPYMKYWREHLLIPEGGATKDALAGIAEILLEDERQFDAIYLPCGTATTLAGLSLGLAEHSQTKLVGIAALKAGNSLDENMRRLIQEEGSNPKLNWTIYQDFHFGGFAKIDNDLVNFMMGLYQRTKLITEPIYTGKTLFALYQHIEQGLYEKGSQIMMLHTGGLQGLRGYVGRGLDELIEQSSVCSEMEIKKDC
ncbi:MAG: 1-aminocyclopropane-1-carboxylate deaminase [Enterobacterales bacterium]|jgi:1-aminocyclopropane-1-carboxylate deaminase